MSAIEQAIRLLASREHLPREHMDRVIDEMLTGRCGDQEMQTFLVGLQQKGETVDELVGAATAMRRSMVRIHSDFPLIVDTCGTGGDGSMTFNISTAAAIVIAATGLPVAKHGNRKITSSTGSADVLAELGINLDAPPEVVERCLNELRLCFCFAPRFHPAMKHVAEVRRRITGPTIFNRLGPLCNPASAHRQVLGVGTSGLQAKLAEALLQLGTQRSIVVRGEDGVDEVSLEGPSIVLEVTNEPPSPLIGGEQSSNREHSSGVEQSHGSAGQAIGQARESVRHTGNSVRQAGYTVSQAGYTVDQAGVETVRAGRMHEFRWSPEDFGLARHPRSALFADTPASSARCIREALSGRPGPLRDAVLINAAAAVWLSRADRPAEPKSDSKQEASSAHGQVLQESLETAREAIDSGRALALIDQLSQQTTRPA